MGSDRVADHRRHGAEVLVGADMSCLMHLEGIIRRGADPLPVMHVAQLLNGERP
jgi:L-lactate dehydrogenase complex protein LldE